MLEIVNIKYLLIMLIRILLVAYFTFWLIITGLEKPEELFGFLIGLGLISNIFYLYKIDKKISKPIQKQVIEKIKNDIEIIKITFLEIYLIIYGMFTGGLYALTLAVKINVFVSLLWLLLAIFTFQGFALYFVLQLIIKGYKPQKVHLGFSTIYIFASIIFGYISAYTARDIFKIPMYPDVLTATYGTLILLFIFNKYLEKLSKP